LKQRQLSPDTSEILVLPNGQILAHNLTPNMAAVLASLNPSDETMAKRAGHDSPRKEGQVHQPYRSINNSSAKLGNSNCSEEPLFTSGASESKPLTIDQ
jgi:hypothetical protein